MKRSRVVDKMCIIYGLLIPANLTPQKHMSAVLEAIENMGMLPPGQEKDLITARTLNGDLIGQTYEKYEWESEDEKK